MKVETLEKANEIANEISELEVHINDIELLLQNATDTTTDSLDVYKYTLSVGTKIINVRASFREELLLRLLDKYEQELNTFEKQLEDL